MGNPIELVYKSDLYFMQNHIALPKSTKKYLGLIRFKK